MRSRRTLADAGICEDAAKKPSRIRAIGVLGVTTPETAIPKNLRADDA